MALTPRFHELITELNLPEAAWHLSRTNSSPEKHATDEEILGGHIQILDLVANKNGCVRVILDRIESELRTIDPMDILLTRRQEAVMQQWRESLINNGATQEYGAIIQAISRRHVLEKTKKQAELILAGGLQVILGGASEIPSSDKPNRLTIAKKKALKEVA